MLCMKVQVLAYTLCTLQAVIGLPENKFDPPLAGFPFRQPLYDGTIISLEACALNGVGAICDVYLNIHTACKFSPCHMVCFKIR